jgi:hypothetical protein
VQCARATIGDDKQKGLSKWEEVEVYKMGLKKKIPVGHRARKILDDKIRIIIPYDRTSYNLTLAPFKDSNNTQANNLNVFHCGI